jgi:hypothetical protein
MRISGALFPAVRFVVSVHNTTPVRVKSKPPPTIFTVQKTGEQPIENPQESDFPENFVRT